MIWLFNTQRRRKSSYKSFEEVCDYFNRLENLKPFIGAHGSYDQGWDDHGPVFEEHWGFIYHLHHKLPALLEGLEELSPTQTIQDAYERELDLVEVFRGVSVAEWVVITPGIDGNDFMREWCLDYAYAHGFVVLETFSRDVVFGVPKKMKL